MVRLSHVGAIDVDVQGYVKVLALLRIICHGGTRIAVDVLLRVGQYDALKGSTMFVQAPMWQRSGTLHLRCLGPERQVSFYLAAVARSP